VGSSLLGYEGPRLTASPAGLYGSEPMRESSCTGRVKGSHHLAGAGLSCAAEQHNSRISIGWDPAACRHMLHMCNLCSSSAAGGVSAAACSADVMASRTVVSWKLACRRASTVPRLLQWLHSSSSSLLTTVCVCVWGGGGGGKPYGQTGCP
jgi:hypothetical protein